MRASRNNKENRKFPLSFLTVISGLTITTLFLVSLSVVINKSVSRKLSQKPVNPRVTMQPTTAPTLNVRDDSGQPNLRTGWKIFYVDQYASKYGSSYNFSVNYPRDWNRRLHDTGTSFDLAFLSPDYQTPQKGFIEGIAEGARVEVFVYQDQVFSDLDDWFVTFYRNRYLHSINKKPQRVSINADIQGIEYELIGNKGLDEVIHAKAFAIGDTVYLFQAVFKENAETYLSILDHMVSTFSSSEEEWRVYKNEEHGFTIKYPARLKVERLGAESFSNPSTNFLRGVYFSSPEVGPDIIMPDELVPEGKEEGQRFDEQYTRISVAIYDNQAHLPLKQFIQQQYSASGLDPKKTEFELMEPDLKPYDGGPRGGLIFVGSVREDPGKIIFFIHKDTVYEIGLGGGAGGTGSMYSKTAEKVFDEMVASISFQ